MAGDDITRSIEAVWRIEAPRLIAGLARATRDVGMAEELAQDALVAALETWPKRGIPDRPAAWLMAAAKNRAVDQWRRQQSLDAKLGEIAATSEQHLDPKPEDSLDDQIGDDLLGLIFTACHPVLPDEARAALTLRVVGGLSVPEIARAYLASEPAIQQRIVRAKRTLAEAGVGFEVPRDAQLAERLPTVLSVIYLIFNEGYAASGGADWIRPELSQEALRLGRVLAGLAPVEPEVHGLVALMEIQASRFAARVDDTGAPVLLLDQNRGRWDNLLIGRGLAALAKAGEAASKLGRFPGPYQLQAEIAACHARAAKAEDTDWRRIAALYGLLARVTPSPIVELNRAVAIAFAEGPEAALTLVDALAEEPALKSYHLLPSVRGDLLVKLGRIAEARAEFERAAALAGNERERTLLLERASACA